MSPEDERDLAAVFKTVDPSLLLVVKSALDAAGIPHIVQGEGGLRLFPLGRFGGGFFRTVLGATIWVPKDRAEEAMEFLRSFDDEQEERAVEEAPGRTPP